jgi:ADP-heptose:LPS heptosyltransferase
MTRLPPADRILILRLGAVGDVVRTLPAASALRAAYPDARITWLVERASASIVEGEPWVDEVLVFPREALRASLVRLRVGEFAAGLRRVVRTLRERRYDLVVDFHSILKSGALAFASGARVRVAYAQPYGRELAWLFATHRARLEPGRISRFERNEALVRFLGANRVGLAQPLTLAPDAVSRMDEALGGGPRPVVIHPGTSPATPHKRYPPAAYAAVARALAKSPGVPSIVTMGPSRDDREAAQAVVAASDGAARPAPPTKDLRDLAALFSISRLYVGGDTGPLHVASLVGTPVVQLIGPTDPVENAPYPGTPSRTVRVQVGCNPCRRGCAAATCMQVIPPDAVAEAARELLARGRTGC